MQASLFERGTATFSADEKHRFLLTRTVSVGGGRLVTIGLNPSTADALTDDNTIRKERGYTMRWGYGTLVKTNLFPFRSTDPKGLLAPEASDVEVLRENDEIILEEAKAASLVLCCWGGPYDSPRRLGQLVAARAAAVTGMLRDFEIELHVLELTKDRFPRHPLYLPGSLTPQRWTP